VSAAASRLLTAVTQSSALSSVFPGGRKCPNRADAFHGLPQQPEIEGSTHDRGRIGLKGRIDAVTHMPTPKLKPEIIVAAIEGFESQKRRIDDQIAGLRQMLEGSSAETAAVPATPERKRRISAAGRASIAEAQRQRWAAKKAAESTATPEAAKPKRKLSAAGRKAIAEATKQRWARVRAEAAKAAKAKRAPAKKAAKKVAGKNKTKKKAARKSATRTASKTPPPVKAAVPTATP